MARGVHESYVLEVYRSLVAADYKGMPVIAESICRTEQNGRVGAFEKHELFSRCLKVFDPTFANHQRVHIGDCSVPLAESRDFLKLKLGID